MIFMILKNPLTVADTIYTNRRDVLINLIKKQASP